MKKTQKKQKVVVLGAGLAGLSAAWKLSESKKFDVIVIEKENYLGGMSTTINHKGYLFDYGGHRFITKRQEIIEEMQKLVGKDFRPGIRQTQYLLWKKFLNYPLELGDLVKKVNPWITFRCLFDYFSIRIKNKFKELPEGNFEAWVVKRFGKYLYEIFFGQYTRKIWGIPPSTISKDWAAQRISIINLGDAVKQLLFKPKEDPRTYTKQYYYCKYGIGQIAKQMAQRIKKTDGKILLNSEPVELRIKQGKIKSIIIQTENRKQEIQTDWVINTAPLTDILRLIKLLPSRKVIQACNKLRYRAVVFVFLILDQGKISDNDALYVPEPQYFFFRIEQYKFWSIKMVPDKKKTSLCLEVTCFKDDEIWKMKNEEIFEKCVVGLEEAGLIKDRDIVKDYFIHRLDYVYPVFEIGYQKHAKMIREYANSIKNFIAYGRQGYYQYIHMHHVIAKGFAAANYLITGKNREMVQRVGTEEEYFG